MELVCPAGNLPSLKTAVEHGADAIYVGLKNNTNARHFPGLNFTPQRLKEANDWVKHKNKKLFVAVNTYASAQGWSEWTNTVDMAADLGVDAIIMADIGLLEYTARKHPQVSLHLSVQASATNAAALTFYANHFGIKRAVLPRVLSLKQVQQVARNSPVAIEVFGFGSLCIMAEGRCHLSSYLTSESPNLSGACSPAKYVQWQQSGDVLETRLNDVLIDRFAENENPGYPTLCKGRFFIDDQLTHALEEPTSLNTIDLIPVLAQAGVGAIKIEGRQRGPAYVKAVVSTWRQGLDAYAANPTQFTVDDGWRKQLQAQSEGKQTTLGAYDRPWQ